MSDLVINCSTKKVFSHLDTGNRGLYSMAGLRLEQAAKDIFTTHGGKHNFWIGRHRPRNYRFFNKEYILISRRYKLHPASATT